MKRARFSEEQIIGILKAAEAVGNIRQACRENNITEQTFYRWRRKFGGNRALGVADDAMGLARIRHMPVIDEDGPVIGLISKRVLFQGALAPALGYGEFAQKKRLGIMRVKQVMTTNVLIIPSSTALIEAATLMIDRKIGCLVVVDQKRRVDILTESGFVKLAVATATNENGCPK